MATPTRTNRIGLEPIVYKGGKTTLCAGCGHNAISERIVDAFFEMGIEPSRVIKLSGIGCSIKSPAYFLGGGPRARTAPRRPTRAGPVAAAAERAIRSLRAHRA